MNFKVQAFTHTDEKINHLTKTNRGFYVKKNHAIIFTIIISFFFAGSILATYFGKPEAVYQKYTSTSGMLLVRIKKN